MRGIELRLPLAGEMGSVQPEPGLSHGPPVKFEIRRQGERFFQHPQEIVDQGFQWIARPTSRRCRSSGFGGQTYRYRPSRWFGGCNWIGGN
jgi:hypothetical protein